MTTEVCLTVDVEDWYDGMAVLGEAMPGRRGRAAASTAWRELLGRPTAAPRSPCSWWATTPTGCNRELAELVAGGHEIASHGPDHGRLPEDPDALVEWLRTGREMIEDLFQTAGPGFRSPRFDVPGGRRASARYRERWPRPGSTTCPTPAGWARVARPRVARAHPPRVPDRRRQLPAAAPPAAVDAARGRPTVPAVLYYHSYDFGATLPGTRSIRSVAVAKQLVGRDRIAGVLSDAPPLRKLRRVVMSNGEFQTYFHRRAGRFAAFYSSEPVARVLGRGPLFDRLRLAVDIAVALGAERVLDVGCGSGPLFAPLAGAGIHVTGIDPAEAMVALATEQAASFPGLVEVEQRGWEQITEVDAYDVAIALGVFDYVGTPAELLTAWGGPPPTSSARSRRPASG